MNNKEYIDELIDLSSFETEFLRSLRISARERGIPVMLKDSASYIASLVSAIKPKSILEIGTAVGYSGSLMLLNAAKDAKLITLEVNEDSAKIAKETFKGAKLDARATCFVGDAFDILRNMSGSFDFIFLDGPKGQYIDYLPYLKSMLAKGGVLVCDNVLFRGMISGQQEPLHKYCTIVRNLREFLKTIFSDKDFTTSVIEVGDGISMSVKSEK